MDYCNFLELIKVVNDHYDHISQLEALEKILSFVQPHVYLSQEQIDKLAVIAATTHNSHYDYKLYTLARFQNPENHIDMQLAKEQKKMVNDDLAALTS